MTHLRIAVAVAITAIWALAFLATIFIDPALSGLATTATPVMLGVVGWLFAAEVLERRNRIPHNPPQELPNESPR